MDPSVLLFVAVVSSGLLFYLRRKSRNDLEERVQLLQRMFEEKLRRLRHEYRASAWGYTFDVAHGNEVFTYRLARGENKTSWEDLPEKQTAEFSSLGLNSVYMGTAAKRLAEREPDNFIFNLAENSGGGWEISRKQT